MKLYSNSVKYVMDMFKEHDGKIYHFLMDNFVHNTGVWMHSDISRASFKRMKEITSNMDMHEINRKEFDRHIKEEFYNDILNERTK